MKKKLVSVLLVAAMGASVLDVVIEEPEKNTKEYLTGYTLKNLFI